MMAETRRIGAVLQSSWAGLHDVRHAAATCCRSPYIRHAEEEKFLGHVWTHVRGEAQIAYAAHLQLREIVE